MRMGTPLSSASLGDRSDVVGLADVAGVQPKAVNSGLQGSKRQLVLEVDVGDQRNGTPGHHVGQALGRGLFVAGAAHDVGPCSREGVDLGQRAVDVGSLGRGHRLDRDRRAPTHGDVSDQDLTGDTALDHASKSGTGSAGEDLPEVQPHGAESEEHEEREHAIDDGSSRSVWTT